jgi:hypothetical protein
MRSQAGMRAASPFNPKPEEFLPQRRGAVHAVPAARHRRPAVTTNWLFGLALVGSTFAGALFTLLLWGGDGVRTTQELRQRALGSGARARLGGGGGQSRPLASLELPTRRQDRAVLA